MKSFFFRYFLALFSQFSYNYLCFQLLLSFVPSVSISCRLFSITYWLRSYNFFVFSNPTFLDSPGGSRLSLSDRASPRPPQTKRHSQTTFIGYHRLVGLSSGKCKAAGRSCDFCPLRGPFVPVGGRNLSTSESPGAAVASGQFSAMLTARYRSRSIKLGGTICRHKYLDALS